MRGNLADEVRRLKPAGAVLPSIILMTDSVRLPDPCAAARQLTPGSAVILRHYDVPGRAALAHELARICRRARVRLLIGGDWRLALAVGADGVHLPESMVWGRAWGRKPQFLVTAAAHSEVAIRRAARIGVDAVLLSPVFPTASHPGANVLGPLRFALWCQNSPVPIYALGGIDAKTVRRLKGSGFTGIAAIGALAGVGTTL